ncbi:MAG: flagellar basal body rod modification protein [Confluentimicrobium sp.]|mgnify:CR=1 FL=1|jgi:flagellar basal-body rod modification protein FlgD|uniref:flagellar hook capping FlgD N-terminal domain-containing protein n=1 Tax=Actibacterium sp. TaxID=1872125 RepID=UPI0005102786|nr:flagellar hook capping FlgD N-terminal domain-containing protein [Actibacterium sp.]KGB83611.1 hypothetical protein JT55_00240 [Rhodovulum sp. NI22]MBC56920.1 flagellar basal body rod modification protein [Actibacterium sp.]MDY6859012.1 flagellar hook capping FlgD N-terminal domain-containing protein [Pseudomonadota bacterium]
MDVTAAAQAAAPRSAKPSDPAPESSDFETFLKMLTTQMQNQDPLNPVESSDFAVQLATFSGVEQQVRTNDLLSALTSQLGAGGIADLAGWVGMEARSTAPALFRGQPVSIAPRPDSGADAAQLVVLDEQGAEVQRLALSVSEDAYLWAGTDAAGIPLPDGLYRFEVESFAGGELLGRSPAEVYSTVAEARIADGQTALVLDSGVSVAAGDVTALRAPS